jgi:hypothetical protein
MQLFFLYLITLVLLVATQLLVHYVANPSSNADSEDEEEVDLEWWKFLVYILLYGLGLLSYAILPSLGKGGLTQAIVSALILSSVSHVGWYLGNFQFSRSVGIKVCSKAIMEAVVSAAILTPVLYLLALWMLM